MPTVMAISSSSEDAYSTVSISMFAWAHRGGRRRVCKSNFPGSYAHSQVNIPLMQRLWSEKLSLREICVETCEAFFSDFSDNIAPLFLLTTNSVHILATDNFLHRTAIAAESLTQCTDTLSHGSCDSVECGVARCERTGPKYLKMPK